MAMLDRGARSFLLVELLQGMWLTFRYMFKISGDDKLPL